MMRKGALIGYKAFSDVAARLCSFAVVLLAARILAPLDFGLFSLAWASGWIVAVAGDFGLQIFLAREVARNPSRAGAIHRTLLKPRLGMAAALLVALAAAAWWLAGPGGMTAFSLVAVAQVFTSLIEFQNHLFRGLSRSDVESGLNLAHRVAGLALSAGFLLHFGTVEALGAALALSAGGTLLVSQALALRLAGTTARDAWRPGMARLAGDVFPMGAGILLSVVYFRVDLFFLESFHGAVEVGLYNAAFRLVDAARMLPAAVLAVIFPDLCRSGGLRPALVSGGALFGVAAGLALLAGWRATWLMEFLYGESYATAGPVLGALAWSLPFLFLNAVLTHQLIGWDRQHAFLWLCAGGLGLSLLLNAWLTPIWGGLGAAWACLIREALLTAGCLIALARTTPSAAALAEAAPEGWAP